MVSCTVLRGMAIWNLTATNINRFTVSETKNGDLTLLIF